MSNSDRIGWREPFRARAPQARAYIRHHWLFIALGGAVIPLVGTTLLVIWWRATDEPVRLTLPLLLLLIGAGISGLLALEQFLPHTIRFGQSSVFLGAPRTVEWIRYSKLARCEISSPPNPQVLGFGPDSQILFAIFLDPRVDIGSLATLLSEKGVTFSAAPPNLSLQRTLPG